ncbi:uncharacterized protein G2W53_016825 [Senna tora]|uniref:Uncharacterized protein n=1 Tax=Senna tora TaxID=362788 RepID=A0A834TRL4_9FABA|nr:uncharacterized protein G2W53_016825 [Senna tora]
MRVNKNQRARRLTAVGLNREEHTEESRNVIVTVAATHDRESVRCDLSILVPSSFWVLTLAP